MQWLHHIPSWSHSTADPTGRSPHIEGAGFRCSVAIASLELIIGTAPAPVMRRALAWARTNQEALMQTWKELNG